ncbi:unnamed protein product [Ambrosiozyma monospora]|uniref:Unnamed protein product n=1 Tax=Ambrosiozyma monospora TaxID=43982 RepID=A0ACB5U9V4_AMBMO|nr:unnamed protein product [Ambrosiozyma monospora]
MLALLMELVRVLNLFKDFTSFGRHHNSVSSASGPGPQQAQATLVNTNTGSSGSSTGTGATGGTPGSPATFSSSRQSSNLVPQQHQQSPLHHHHHQQPHHYHHPVGSSSSPQQRQPQEPIHLISTDEIKLLFSNQSGSSAADHQSQASGSDDQQNSNSATTTGFNFIPVWLPEFTQDDETVYHDQSLNIYTKSLPLLSADQLIEDNNNNTLFEIPDSTKFNGVDTLPITLMPGEHDHPDPSDRSGGTVGQVRPGQQAQGAKQPVPLIDAISPAVNSNNHNHRR